MGKYDINKEFGIYRYMKTPVMPLKMAGFMGGLMKAPRWIWRDSELAAASHIIPGYNGGELEVLMLEPRNARNALPCLVYFHGGGFFFGAAGYHYSLAKKYALGAGCKVAFVQYRLSPAHKFPIPAEDSYLAYLWILENAAELGVDTNRTAVGGDSAGGCLCAAAALMCRDRGKAMPLFQLLIYPVTDRRMEYLSCRKYTDTPMWHSRLSAGMWRGYLPDPDPEHIEYASPMEAGDFGGLPPAYVELAEFDCLHDEGLAYACALRNAGTEVELCETKGTMHGFDIAENTETAKIAVWRRIDYMKKMFDVHNV